jgi:23S rRNA pseudouridine2605 synthase
LMSLSGLEKAAGQAPSSKERGDRKGNVRNGNSLERDQESKRGQGQARSNGRSQGQGRSRQPDPLQTALGFPDIGQARRSGGAMRGGMAMQGLPRRRSRG